MNLIFDTGEVEVQINDDPTKVIRFSPTDFSFAERLEKMSDQLTKYGVEYQQKLKMAKAIKNEKESQKIYYEILKKSNEDCRKMVNSLFNDEVADVIFGRVHPLTVVKGKYVIVNFLDSLNKFIENSFGDNLSEEDKQAIDDYKKAYDSLPS